MPCLRSPGRGSCRPPELRRALSKAPFVILDDGSAVVPGAVCIDLEEADKLGDMAVAVPQYLEPFSDVLKACGASTMSALSAPRCVLRGTPPLHGLQQRLIAMRDEATLCDVVLRSEDGEEGKEGAGSGADLPAHRLVLAMGSAVFRSMFTLGMREAHIGAGAGGSVVVHVPATAAVTVRLRDYLYGVPVAAVLAGLDPAQWLQLLRLADAYGLEHLKSAVEVQLCVADVMDVYNAAALLTHAHACNAAQLARFCVHACREMYQVVSQTAEWGAVPAELQQRVRNKLHHRRQH